MQEMQVESEVERGMKRRRTDSLGVAWQGGDDRCVHWRGGGFTEESGPVMIPSVLRGPGRTAREGGS